MAAEFLIVDHDPLVRACCQKCLSARGFDVAVAADGLQCLQRLQENPPEVLVIDTEILWGGDGVLEYLRQEAPFHMPTVVLANGHAQNLLSPKLQDMVSTRLERPTSLAEMVSFVDRLEVLYSGRPQSQSVASQAPTERSADAPARFR